jgi:hypothetical protein
MGIRNVTDTDAQSVKCNPARDFGTSLTDVASESAETPVEGEIYSELSTSNNTAYNSYNFSSSVSNIIKNAARKYGVNPQLMMDIAQIESSGRPHAVSGSCVGLFQLSRRSHSGDLLNPATNATIAAKELKQKITRFNEEYGRNPTATEIYMMHQQGDAGARAHLKSPNEAAWKNIRRFYRSDSIAKKAVWNNIPANMKNLFPKGVETVSSAEFMAIWAVKCEGLSFEAALARYQDSAINMRPLEQLSLK